MPINPKTSPSFPPSPRDNLSVEGGSLEKRKEDLKLIYRVPSTFPSPSSQAQKNPKEKKKEGKKKGREKYK